MKIDTTIKKRRFYLVQHLGGNVGHPIWNTKHVFDDLPSQAEVTFDGFRRKVFYSVQDADRGFGEGHDWFARRLIGQPSTRHITGEQLTAANHLGSCCVLLGQRDILSLPYDPDRTRPYDVETGFVKWCQTNMVGWFDRVEQYIDDPKSQYGVRHVGFALFEDDNDAFFFKMRWCGAPRQAVP